MSIVVVGAGVSGLSAAYYLTKLSKLSNKPIGKVILIESSNRLGGWIDTHQNPQNGVLHEYGARSLRCAGPAGQNALELTAQLGLESDILIKDQKDPNVKNRYIATEEGLFTVPNSLRRLFFRQKPLKQSMIRHFLNDITTPKLDLSKQSFDNQQSEKKIIDANLELLNEPELEDISIYEFVKLRFGSEDFANYLADPMLRGITSGDVRTLSARSLAKHIFEGERRTGSILKSLLINNKEDQKSLIANTTHLPETLKKINTTSVWSFKEGMGQLPRAIAKELMNESNFELRLSNKLTDFEVDENNQLNLNIVNVNDKQKYQIKADQVFLALNAADLASLIPKNEKLATLKSTLNTIKSTTVGTVNLEFNKKDLLKKYPGFGFLIPSHINSSILGVIFDSLLFPELDRSNEITRLSVMAGGDWYKEIAVNDNQLDESKLIEKSISVLAKYLQITDEPSFVKINHLKNCIPQYRVGHYLKLKLLDKEINEKNLKLSLIGSSYSGISVNDCIYNSKMKVLDYIRYINSCE